MEHNRSTELLDMGQSDSDDWTLVSRPRSSSSSSSSSSISNTEKQPLVEIPVQEEIVNDGLLEIDLHEDLKEPMQARSKRELNAEDSSELLIPGFQPVESTSEDGGQSVSPNSSRKSSLTQSELNDYVDLGRHENQGTEEEEKSYCRHYSSKSDAIDEVSQQALVDGSSSVTNAMLKQKMDELSEVAGLLMTNRRLGEFNQISRAYPRRPITRKWLVLHLVVLLIHVGVNHLLINNRQTSNVNQAHKQQFQHTRSNMGPFVQSYGESSGSAVPASQKELKLELQLLQDELSECIKRQSPTSYKYYLSDARDAYGSSKSGREFTLRPYKGLVCYGQESHWRNRFEKVRHEYNLDLRKLINDAKRKVTNEMLEFHHPSLQFKLILNQIEYLDFLENKRKSKKYDETIKYLRGENLRLIRSLSDRGRPSEASSHKKHISSLEAENAKLKRQIDTLTASLSMKAGPTYMKQSLELEHYCV